MVLAASGAGQAFGASTGRVGPAAAVQVAWLSGPPRARVGSTRSWIITDIHERGREPVALCGT